MPGLICLREKTLNEDLFNRESSANQPRLHTCKTNVPFWDFSQFAVTKVSNFYLLWREILNKIHQVFVDIITTSPPFCVPTSCLQKSVLFINLLRFLKKKIIQSMGVVCSYRFHGCIQSLIFGSIWKRPIFYFRGTHMWESRDIYIKINKLIQGGARGVMVIVVGNGHGDTSSNPGRDWLHFT